MVYFRENSIANFVYLQENLSRSLNLEGQWSEFISTFVVSY